MKAKNLNQSPMEENKNPIEKAMTEILQIAEEMNELKITCEKIEEENRIMQSDMYMELKKKYWRLEREHKNLQVEHSRLLFDMDAVIEHEVKKKLENFYTSE